MDTKEKILRHTASLFAIQGYEGFNIRLLAKKVGIVPSVIYHYFPDKDTLLKAMFDYLNTDLGKKRKLLSHATTASEMLRQRIVFQLDNAEAIVAVLKFFITYRKKFPKFEKGYVPDKSSLHIEEVLSYGVQTGEFSDIDIKKDAKVITHAINGFLLEYYPDTPKGKERDELVTMIHTFLLRALTKGGEKE